ncbi:hypothetical protein [Micromonospora sp. NPDC049374]|uniref:hypothetical protein n=1 Tax=Micromonospora sp. NPDC049374 TaxID=3154352 RepID=UPI00341CB244
MNARTRVVLLIDAADPRGQARVLAWLDKVGAELMALVRPEDFRHAHRLVADGEVDLIVTPDVAGLPGVLVASPVLMARMARDPQANAATRVTEPDRPEMVRSGGLGAVVERPTSGMPDTRRPSMLRRNEQPAAPRPRWMRAGGPR